MTNSTTEEVMGTIPDGTPADVDAAVAAAKAAFPAWAATAPDERAKFCARIADALGARMDEVATLISQEVGMVKSLSKIIQAGLPYNSFNVIPQVVADFAWEEKVGNSLIVREPVGVVGAITPWNYPLHQIAAKVAYALAAGCTVVLKPSEVAPLNAFVLGDIAAEVGLPAGVFNLVSGTGPVVGEAIASHPDVDMVSFTGSTRAGKRVGELCMRRVAKVALELGGKSANLILDGADLDKAVRDGVGKAFLNSGQTCSALTRMVVPRSRLAEVEQLAAAAAEAMTPGDPFAKESRLGPLVSQVQWDRVQNYINVGIEEGAKLVTGGPGKPDGLPTGYFVKPTVFSEVAPGHANRSGRDLRTGAVHPPLRQRGGGRRDRQRLRVWTRGRRLGWRSGPRRRRRSPHPHRAGRSQRWGVQSQRPVRRLQAVGYRPGIWALRPGGIPRSQGPPAVAEAATAPVGTGRGRRTCAGSIVTGAARSEAGSTPRRPQSRPGRRHPSTARPPGCGDRVGPLPPHAPPASRLW